MAYVIAAVLALAAMIGLIQLFNTLDPRTLARIGRYVIAFVLLAVGLASLAFRQFFFGLPVLVLGLAALRRGRIGSFNLGGSATTQRARTSDVRARFVTATLDHDTGRLSGRVTDGAFKGRSLDALSDDDLRALLLEAAADPDSVALVEAYLDRRNAGWREDRERDEGPRAGGAADTGAMTDKEAYEILGLPAGAGEAEIRAAHRRLLKGVHPDQGGSTFLASRINQARDRLLGRHR